MKNRVKTMILCLSAAMLLSACGGGAKNENESKAPETASAVSEENAAADEADIDEMEEDEVLSYSEDPADIDEAEYFAEEDYVSTSESLIEEEMENPYGDNVKVNVWEGIENVQDTDGATYSTLSSYANNISVDYEILKASGAPEDVLKAQIRQAVTDNMGYVGIKAESARHTDSSAWVLLSFTGKGMTPYAQMLTVSNAGDGVMLKSSASYALGLDAYGIDSTPEDKYLTMVRDAFGISPTAGEEVSLSEEDTKPEISFHKYEFEDSRVGSKFFYVWENEPYIMTADDMAAYDDYDFDYDESGAESMSDFIDLEDGEYDIELTESDLDWGMDAGSYAEWAEGEESDVEWADLTDSDLDWYMDTESGAEDYGDYSDYEEEEDNFIAYGSTSAAGVFVNMEMYVKSETDDIKAMMDEYVDGLVYMGANALKRSEVQTADGACWVVAKYGSAEEDPAYSDLTMIHAIIEDDDSYITFDIYAPSDCDSARLQEVYDAYGIADAEAKIEVEQESYDYEDVEFDEDDMIYEDELSGAEAVPVG